MLGKVRSLDERLLTRRCVACGYDGALLQGGRAERCAKCGVDLTLRPARSYAEMECLLGQPFTLHAPLDEPVQEEKIIHRWLAFLFMVMIGMMGILYLCAAAMAV